MKVHFIGIGGFGMSGLAEYLINQGNIVSGSDISDSNIIKRLLENGAAIGLNHSALNIKKDTDLVVYSSAIASDNVDYIEAKRLKIETIRRAEMLGRIVNDK